MRNSEVVETVLRKAIRLEELIKTQPELFDLSNLNIHDKCALVLAATNAFLPMLKDSLTVTEKAEMIIYVNKKVVRDSLPIADDELSELSSDIYYKLVMVNINIYGRDDLIEDLPHKYKMRLVQEDPKWMLENIIPPPKLTSDVLWSLAHKYPALVEKYVPDFTGFSTSEDFWIKMIKFDSKYKEIFLRNTNGLLTKTDVRRVVRRFPSLIKELKEDMLVVSKLTIKEWVLLCNSVINAKANKKVFENWDFSPEMKEVIRLDSMADVLSGKAKLTKQFSSAMANVVNNAPVEAEEEKV